MVFLILHPVRSIIATKSFIFSIDHTYTIDHIVVQMVFVTICIVNTLDLSNKSNTNFLKINILGLKYSPLGLDIPKP